MIHHSSQHQKTETAIEDLLQKGIDEGYVQRHIEEVVLADLDIVHQLSGHFGKIDEAAQHHVTTNDQGIHAQCQSKGRQDVFLTET